MKQRAKLRGGGEIKECVIAKWAAAPTRRVTRHHMTAAKIIPLTFTCGTNAIRPIYLHSFFRRTALPSACPVWNSSRKSSNWIRPTMPQPARVSRLLLPTNVLSLAFQGSHYDGAVRQCKIIFASQQPSGCLCNHSEKVTALFGQYVIKSSLQERL